ncbi:Ras GTPase activating protein ira2 [Irineochytrium annulatum]|nr:Ras GTPase activating protein ira2 [Irineochytrium annulatum]
MKEKLHGARSFQTLHAESMLSLAKLNNLTLTVEQRISNTLLANNCNLLAMVCQAPFVGDEAAAMSKGVLSLLGRQRGNLNERFLKRVLRAKIAQHLRKGRDVSDIIRDNNMAAMLFGAFARHEGMGFLSRTLAPPIRQITDLLDKCELDPAKVPDPALLQAQTENLARLCTELLSSVVDARNTLPASLRRLCSFMKSLIDEVTAAQEAGVHTSVIERRVEHGEAVIGETGGGWRSRSTSAEKDAGEETYTCSCHYDGNGGDINSGSNCQFAGLGNTATPPAGASPSPLAVAPISNQRTPVASNESLSSSKGSLNAEGNPLLRLFARRKGKREAMEPSGLHKSKSSTIIAGGSQNGDGQLVPLAKSEAYSTSTVPTRRISTGRGEGKYVPTSWPMAAKDAISENDTVGSAGHDVTSPTSHRNSNHAHTCPHHHGHARGSHRHSVLQPNLFSPPTTDALTDQPLAPIPDGNTPPNISVQPPSCTPAYLLNDVALGTSPDEVELDPFNVYRDEDERVEYKRGGAGREDHWQSQRFRETSWIIPFLKAAATRFDWSAIYIVKLKCIEIAVTAPDVFGIIDTKLTPQMRRGLVLSVKVLTALCNDIEFGAKEAYLTPMNSFLNENRANIKEFLNFAAQDPDTQSEDGSNEELSSAQAIDAAPFRPTHRHAFSTSNLRPGLSTSMPSLNHLAFDAPSDDMHHNSASTVNLKSSSRQFPRSTSTTSRLGSSTQQIRRSRSEDLADVGTLLTHLGRSMELIEKDLEGRIATLGPRESEGVLANFFEMKRLVESSQYSPKNEEKGGTVGKSSGMLLAKLVKFNLGFKGLLKR